MLSEFRRTGRLGARRLGRKLRCAACAGAVALPAAALCTIGTAVAHASTSPSPSPAPSAKAAPAPTASPSGARPKRAPKPPASSTQVPSSPTGAAANAPSDAVTAGSPSPVAAQPTASASAEPTQPPDAPGSQSGASGTAGDAGASSSDASATGSSGAPVPGATQEPPRAGHAARIGAPPSISRTRGPASPLPLNLDSTSIAPVVALTPMSGLDFGSGFQVGPPLLFLDAVGLGLAWVLTRRYLRASDDATS